MVRLDLGSIDADVGMLRIAAVSVHIGHRGTAAGRDAFVLGDDISDDAAMLVKIDQVRLTIDEGLCPADAPGAGFSIVLDAAHNRYQDGSTTVEGAKHLGVDGTTILLQTFGENEGASDVVIGQAVDRDTIETVIPGRLSDDAHFADMGDTVPRFLHDGENGAVGGIAAQGRRDGNGQRVQDVGVFHAVFPLL